MRSSWRIASSSIYPARDGFVLQLVYSKRAYARAQLSRLSEALAASKQSLTDVKQHSQEFVQTLDALEKERRMLSFELSEEKASRVEKRSQFNLQLSEAKGNYLEVQSRFVAYKKVQEDTDTSHGKIAQSPQHLNTTTKE